MSVCFKLSRMERLSMKKDEALLARISAEIAAELGNVRKVKKEFSDFRKKYPISDRHLIRAQASYLEDFYNACEKIFRFVAEELNGGVPKGENWHKTLLYDMSLQIGKRPALLSSRMYEELRNYLGFRHIVRHIYGFSLDPGRVEKLSDLFPAIANRFCREMEEFIHGSLRN